MSHPYRTSRRGIAFAVTLVGLSVAALVTWALVRHDPVMAELRLAADRVNLQSTVLLPPRPETTIIPEEAAPTSASQQGTAEPGPAEPSAADQDLTISSSGSSVIPSSPQPADPVPNGTDESPAEQATSVVSPLVANAEPFDGPNDVPRIALIINDLGMLGIQTEAAITAPSAVTLAFSPYGRNLETWIDQARQAGHETLIMLPMEPLDYPRDDPGPLALLTNLSTSDNAERLDRIIAEAGQSVGIIGQAGSQFLNEPDALEPVMATLADAGFLYVDTNLSDDRVGQIAESLGLPSLEIDLVVTDPAFRGAIDQRLLELETIARERGYAVGLADAFPVFLEQLTVWSERLPTRGFVLAPVTAVINDPDRP